MAGRRGLEPKANADGPVFISYRRSDGSMYADLIEAFLWAGGIAPWHDVIDLPAGETDLRIREAFRDGISSAILLVTEEIGASNFIPEVELPALLELDAKSPNSSLRDQVSADEEHFRLYIVNTIALPRYPSESLEADLEAPDRLLRTDEMAPLPGDTEDSVRGAEPLKRRQQYALLPENRVPILQQLLRDLIRQRLAIRQSRLADRQIDIDVQTRPTPDAHTRSHRGRAGDQQVDLAIRLIPEMKHSAPRELSYRCLQHALPVLIDEIYNRQVDRITFSGGGHPSVLWALGASIPEARHPLGSVEFLDHRFSGAVPPTAKNPSAQQPREGERAAQVVWQEHTNPNESLPGDQRTHRVVLKDKDETDWPLHQCVAKLTSDAKKRREQHPGASAEIFVLMSAGDPNVDMVKDLVETLPNCTWVQLKVEPIDPDQAMRFFPPNEGHRLAQELADKLRGLHRAVNSDLHVATSLPVGLMLLTARRCNTVPVIWYEPETNQDASRSYRRVLRCESGLERPITHVFSRHSSAPVTKLINCTEREVALLNEHCEQLHVWPAPADTAELLDTSKTERPLVLDQVDVPLTGVAESQVINLPARADGVGYIVDRDVARASGRRDCYFPMDEVCQDGQVIGYLGLGRFSGPQLRANQLDGMLER